MWCQNAHACHFQYFKYVLPAGPISTSIKVNLHLFLMHVFCTQTHIHYKLCTPTMLDAPHALLVDPTSAQKEGSDELSI